MTDTQGSDFKPASSRSDLWRETAWLMAGSYAFIVALGAVVYLFER